MIQSYSMVQIWFSSSFQSSQSGGNNMNLSDLPTFTPSTFPPSAFNYERPRHFIQSQPAFQAPSYDSVLKEAQENQNNSQQNLNSAQKSPNVLETQIQTKAMSTQSQSFSQSASKSLSETQSQLQSLSLSHNQYQSAAPPQIHIQANGTAKSSPSSSSLSSPVSTPASSAVPALSSAGPILSHSPTSFSSLPSSSLPRTTMRSTITLTPSVPSATGLGSATLPANQDSMSASAAYLCSVLPSQSSSKLSPNTNRPLSSTSPSRSPLAPSSPLLPLRTSFSSSALPQQPPPVSSSLPCSPLSSSSSPSCVPQQPFTPSTQNSVQPAVVSLPASYKGTPST